MSVQTIAEINQKATHVLVKEIGVVDTIRFLNQYSNGSGDYTKDRVEFTDNLSLDQIYSEIKKSR